MVLGVGASAPTPKTTEIPNETIILYDPILLLRVCEPVYTALVNSTNQWHNQIRYFVFWAPTLPKDDYFYN